MRITHIAAMAVVIAPLLLPQSPAPMSHEETVVRTTYARLSFATQIEEIYKITVDAANQKRRVDRGEFATRLRDAALRFELSDFKVGDISEISQIKYSALVTKPAGGDALDIHAGTWNLATDEPKETHSSIAVVRWHRQQNISEDWEQPFGVIHSQTEVAGQYSRYAAYKVKATFQNRSIEYRAMFLFGKDKTDQEIVLPIDTIANLSGSSLNFFLKVPAYPGTLIEGGVGKDPVIYDWLTSNQLSRPDGKSHEVNCDLALLKCGVRGEDLKKLTKSSSGIHRISPMRPHLMNASFHLPTIGFPFFQAPADCSKFNNSTPPVDLAQANDLNHITGNHIFTSTKSTSCTYSNGSNSNGLCNTSCSAPITAIWDESGVVSSSCHQNGTDLKQGSTNATGAGADCTGGAGGGVKACLFCQCNVTVSVTVSGATVTATSDGFFTAQDQITNKCAAQTQPTPTPTPTPTPPPPPPCGRACLPDPCLDSVTVGPTEGITSTGGGGDAPDCSPIIIDTTGQGFHLTSAADGVLFDIAGTGNPIRIGWTAPGSGNAFLALPDSGGVVMNGTQLFGNFTPQPASSRPNGFLALAVYDKPDHGGNNDGMIDQRDQVFASLRLWIDDNHDGVCQPEELHKLPDLGVLSIDLTYSLSHRVDQFGNVFRYRADINPGISGKASSVDRKAFDVFFTVK